MSGYQTVLQIVWVLKGQTGQESLTGCKPTFLHGGYENICPHLKCGDEETAEGSEGARKFGRLTANFSIWEVREYLTTPEMWRGDYQAEHYG